MTIQSLYPVSPNNVPLSVTNPTASFKQEVKKVMISIVLFFIVYILLMLISVALAIGCLYAGVTVMAASGHIIGIIAGLGIISIGIMVFIFLIKFIFSVKKHDESGTVALTEEEQPELFRFIRQLTADTHTQFPKKIVISPEVNACVYYNDSFWSMLFPVKKNLQIGLALVNSLTLSEFKAVMAHEFGHFSQRSMKLGSFVYHVNKAIFNMLYENKDFGNFLSKWGSLHFAIGIFVWVTIQLVHGIQYILQFMYGFINKNYMGLSRQMEFHADAVAASVSGSNNCITSLRKLEISDMCYQNVLQKANEWLPENVRLDNVYSMHNEVMLNYAAENKLPVENATPVPDETFFKNFKLHKININDQWASHPPREERESHLQELNVEAVKDMQPAWAIFKDPEKLQQLLTAQLYKTVPDLLEAAPLNAAAFKERYTHDIENFRLPAAYNGFYDDRQINEMDMDTVCGRAEDLQADINDLFSDDHKAIIRSLAGNEYDATMLKAIVEKQIAVKTFDYDGEKMEKSAAQPLLENLEVLVNRQKEQLQQQEEKIVAFFYHTAKKISMGDAELLKEKYKTYFSIRKDAVTFIETAQRIMNVMEPLLLGQSIEIENAQLMARSLMTETETLKPYISGLLKMHLYHKKPVMQKNAETFVNSNYHYFSNNSFFENELNSLHQLLIDTASLNGEFQFTYFKEILVYQLSLYEKSAIKS